VAPRKSNSRSTASKSRTRRAPLDSAAIDALYGLEPVYEPGAPAIGDGLTPFVTIQCPYCWERYETQVDLSGGSASYVEDCQVCCRPMDVGVGVGVDGRLKYVRTQRMD
jgi:hypothetical protein